MFKQSQINSVEFAKNHQTLQSDVAINSLSRLQEYLHDSQGQLDYSVSGGLDLQQRPILRVQIKGQIELICQRCLGALSYPLNLDRVLTLFDSEEKLAQATDADDSLNGVLASAELVLAEMVEEEILLELPMVPRHQQCDSSNYQTDLAKVKAANPFSVLEKLKKS